MVAFRCSNAHKLVVAEKHIGRKTRCPKCGVVVVVPEVLDEVEVLDFIDEPALPGRREPPRSQRPGRTRKPVRPSAQDSKQTTGSSLFAKSAVATGGLVAGSLFGIIFFFFGDADEPVSVKPRPASSQPAETTVAHNDRPPFAPPNNSQKHVPSKTTLPSPEQRAVTKSDASEQRVAEAGNPATPADSNKPGEKIAAAPRTSIEKPGSLRAQPDKQVPALKPNGPLEITKVTLEDCYTGFAFDPETGMLAAETNRIDLYSLESLAKGEKIASAHGFAIRAMRFKRYKEKLYLTARQTSALSIIDADRPRRKKSIRLPKDAYTGWMSVSSDPEDPLILCSTRNSGVAINLETMNVTASLGRTVHLSRDGKFLYLGGSRIYKRLEPTGSAVFGDNGHIGLGPNDRARWLNDAVGNLVCGKEVYTPALKWIGEYQDTPDCFSQTEPLMFSVRPPGRGARVATIHAASQNTFKRVGRKIELKEVNPAPIYTGSVKLGEMEVFADDRRRRLLVLWPHMPRGRHRTLFDLVTDLYIIPYDAFQAPPEPLMPARLEGTDGITVNQPANLRLVTGEGTNVVFTDLPEGMQVNGNELAWTPSYNSPLRATINTTISAPTADGRVIRRACSFDLTVHYPSWKLPFAPYDFQLDDDGKRAVFWSTPPQTENLRLEYRPSDNGTQGTPPMPLEQPQLAIVDLTTGRVIAQRGQPEKMLDARITGDSVVAIDPRSQTISATVLDAKTLKKQKSIRIENRIAGISAGDNTLTLHGREANIVWDLQRMRKRRTKKSLPPQFRRHLPAISVSSKPNKLSLTVRDKDGQHPLTQILVDAPSKLILGKPVIEEDRSTDRSGSTPRPRVIIRQTQKHAWVVRNQRLYKWQIPRGL